MVHSTRDPSLLTGQHVQDEIALIQRAQNGDEHAFAILYEHYFDPIHLYLARMVGRDDVGSELAQETFLKAWKSLPNLRQPATFVGWLYRIATNTAYDFQRQMRHKSSISYDEQPTLLKDCFTSGPEDLIEAQEQLRMALASITWKYRSCVVLYYIHGCSKRDIARLLALKESSVGTYISQGFEELRQAQEQLRISFARERGGKNA